MLKIISGGQTGVDRAALEAALQLGIACGGYCPRGRKSEDGVIPEKYPLTETKTDNYSERTELNVKNSDGTLILAVGTLDTGTSLTIELCKRFNKPWLLINLDEQIQLPGINSWLEQHNIEILNVAGNRESISRGIYRKALKFLLEAFQDLNLS